MPSRVIRGEIVASESLSRVSMQADLTFRSLIVACDDFGRIDGRLPALKALLFPLREEVTLKKLDGWLAELEAGPDPCIERYVVDGRPFVAMTGWEKHRGKGRRGSCSKCPEPLPRKSADCHADPPGNRESGDGNRESGDGNRDRLFAPRKQSTSKTPVPDLLSFDDAVRVTNWAAKRTHPITPEQLAYGWDVFKAQARSKGYAYVDHAQAFQNALGATGEAWALKGFGQNPTGEPESPAQAKVRRTKEAGAKAYEMIMARKNQLGLQEIEGGQS